MFAVVFEVCPAEGKKDEYLTHARELEPILEEIDGFIDNERFESKLRPGWMLSLSTWRDEKSVIRWRVQSKHHGIQERGRSGIFADYHLRVCEITADTNPPAGIPVSEQRFDETEVGSAKGLAITEISPASDVAPSIDPSIFADYRARQAPSVFSRARGRCRRMASGRCRQPASSSCDENDPRLWHVRPPRDAAVFSASFVTIMPMGHMESKAPIRAVERRKQREHPMRSAGGRVSPAPALIDSNALMA